MVFLEDEDREDFGGSSSFLDDDDDEEDRLLESPFVDVEFVLESFEGDFGSEEEEEGPTDSTLIAGARVTLLGEVEGRVSDSVSSFSSSSLLLLSISSSSSILLRGEFLMVCSCSCRISFLEMVLTSFFWRSSFLRLSSLMTLASSGLSEVDEVELTAIDWVLKRR